MEQNNNKFDSKEFRERNLGRVEVLSQVKELLILSNTEFSTTEMVAEYYQSEKKTIEKLTERHGEELASNGYEVVEGKQLADIKSVSGIKSRAKKLALYSPRAVLNVGMLLTGSDVAEEVRSRLLDITQDAQTEAGANINQIVEEIDEEMELQKELGQAYFNGDLEQVIIVSTKINALKNKRITELKEKLRSLSH